MSTRLSVVKVRLKYLRSHLHLQLQFSEVHYEDRSNAIKTHTLLAFLVSDKIDLKTWLLVTRSIFYKGRMDLQVAKF